ALRYPTDTPREQDDNDPRYPPSVLADAADPLSRGMRPVRRAAVAGLHRRRIHARRRAVRWDPAAALRATWRSDRQQCAAVRARARERARSAQAGGRAAAQRARALGEHEDGET